MQIRKLPRLVTSGILVLGLLVARGASAQTIFFSGWTNGAFCTANPITCANPATTNAYQTATFTTAGANGQFTKVLKYGNAVFSGSSVNGSTLNLNGAATPYGTQNVNNFGAFYLPFGGNVTYSSPFSLWINFTSPQTSTLVFGALVSGTITAGQGTVNIAFSPNSQNLVFNSGNGWATITVNNVGTPAEGYSNVTGLITAQVTPEPFTMSLVGTGLLGLAGFARRRRKQNQQLAA